MRKANLLILAGLVLTCACSPKQYLTRRLAGELIISSDAFRTTQRFWLRTGTVSNRDYTSPEYLVLQRHGWITGANEPCPADIGPPPCWDVALSPLGVDTFRDLVQSKTAESNYFSVPVARRQLVAVSGISKNDPVAQVDFVWKWEPLNAVGTALYGGGVQYNSSVGFRHYDDGWRLIEASAPRTYQSLDDALKAAQPVQ